MTYQYIKADNHGLTLHSSLNFIFNQILHFVKRIKIQLVCLDIGGKYCCSQYHRRCDYISNIT